MSGKVPSHHGAGGAVDGLLQGGLLVGDALGGVAEAQAVEAVAVLHGNDVGCPEAQALCLGHRRLVARAVQELQQPPAPPAPCISPAPCTMAVTAGDRP